MDEKPCKASEFVPFSLMHLIIAHTNTTCKQTINAVTTVGVESVSNGVNREKTENNRQVNNVTPVPIVCTKVEQTMVEKLENPGAQELMQENQTAVEPPEAE